VETPEEELVSQHTVDDTLKNDSNGSLDLKGSQRLRKGFRKEQVVETWLNRSAVCGLPEHEQRF
jgi:hypothetical protein